MAAGPGAGPASRRWCSPRPTAGWSWCGPTAAASFGSCRGDGTAGAPAVSPDGALAAFILERGDACDVAVVPLDGSAWPVRELPARLRVGPGVVARRSAARVARVGPAGDAVGGLAPRDRRRARRRTSRRRTYRRRRRNGACGARPAALLARGCALAYVTDADGPTRIMVARANGSRPVALRTEAYEHAPPSWSPGLRTLRGRPTVVPSVRPQRTGLRPTCAANRRGTVTTELGKGFHQGIDWSPRGIAAVRAGAAHAASGGRGRPAVGARRSLARGPVGGFEACGLVEPAAVRWRSGGATVHGLLYRPSAATRRRGRRNAPPPMLVSSTAAPPTRRVPTRTPCCLLGVARVAVLAATTAVRRGMGGHTAKRSTENGAFTT